MRVSATNSIVGSVLGLAAASSAAGEVIETLSSWDGVNFILSFEKKGP